jgi:putative transposase
MRKPRTLKGGAKYHISAKINRGEFIFNEKEIKDLFLEIIKRSKKKYKFLLIHFVIMSNHLHLIVHPQYNENLSRIMQWILSVFAIHYNKKYKITGHVFQDRFWSRVIEDIKDLFKTFEYISENPVRAGIVTKAEEYIYSGYYHILKGIFDIIDKPEFNFIN